MHHTAHLSANVPTGCCWENTPWNQALSAGDAEIMDEDVVEIESIHDSQLIAIDVPH